MASALAATEAGMSVALLEKDCLVGGGTALSAGGIWAGCNHLEKAANIPDSREDVLSYVRFVSGGAADDELLTTFVDVAPVALEFFDRCGVKMQLVPGFTDHYFPVAPGSTEKGRTIECEPVSIFELGEWGPKIRDSHIDPHRVGVNEFVTSGGLVNRKGRNDSLVAERNEKGIRTCGAALIVHFLKANLERGTSVFLETAVKRLWHDQDGVHGVDIADGRRIRAKRGVVLATGGWEGDPELAETFEGLPGICSAFPKAVSGDGLRLAWDAGAASAVIRNNLSLILGFFAPPKKSGQEAEFRHSQVRECACPHNIIVNARGMRFSDESYFQDTTVALREYDVWTRQFANLPSYLIFDQQYVENFAFCGSDPGVDPPDWVSRADTLEELARMFNISETGLRATIERFNGFAREGVDHDFHRGEKKWRQGNPDAIKAGSSLNRALGSIEKPPFYGVQMFPAPVVPSGGVRIDRNGQVRSAWGSPIPNLYAVGNVAAHLEFGIGYQAGFSLTSGMTFGYLCAEHMKQK